ncbi:TRAP transporter small permease [Halomonas sp. HL-93]|uniref:TRAP transporter small permease n=1 Tax=Halomonas sp. HL-93 TaxID=1666906 RepID=UPI0006D96989|nr:TRAP transporter small permease [Halomonas sp. HL-93]KPQ21326.1 MAG: TRAP-type C4-dicarboxylate transport system, small permease component [Halomonas sp. HL-93]SBR46550.1 TRAP-type C4-dicarboxylate transport system, small permease component [Halomonas sp. HL-93]
MKGIPDARPERWLGALALIVISLISLGNVVTRYLTGGSFSFTEELSVFLLVVLTFAGASVALRRQRHIRISFLERLLPPRMRRLLILFQALCTLVVLGLISGFGGLMVWQEYQWESLSPGLGVPQWWYLIWLPILTLAMVWRLFQQTRDRLAGRESDDA